MKRRGLAVAAASLVTCAAPGGARASGWEIQGLVGVTAPTYSQTFRWSPPALPDLRGVSIQQHGTFDLEATGGAAFAASLTWFATGGVGLEARIDTADVTLETRNARFSVRIPSPAPLPDVDTDVVLEPARVDLKRVTPVSLDLRLRTPGPVALNLSGGVSYLPRLQLSVVQPLAIGVRGLGRELADLDLGEAAVRALPETDTNRARIGVNLGVGLQLRLGSSVSIGAEARGFLFPERRLVWDRADARSSNAAEEAVVDEALRQLRPIEFAPTLIEATAGIAIRF